MTEDRQAADRTTARRSPHRGWRWGTYLGLTAAVYGMATVAWHVLLGHSWGDALTLTIALGVSVTLGVRLGLVIRRRAGRVR
jgi:hypothetical protein